MTEEEEKELRQAIARAHWDLAEMREKPRFTWGFAVRHAMDRLCRVMVKFKIRREEAISEKHRNSGGAARAESGAGSLAK